MARQTQVQYSEFPLELLRHSSVSSTKPYHILLDLWLVFIYSFSPALVQQNNVSFALAHCRACKECLCHSASHGQALSHSCCSAGADYHWWTCAHGKENYSAVTLETGFYIWPTQKSQQCPLYIYLANISPSWLFKAAADVSFSSQKESSLMKLGVHIQWPVSNHLNGPKLLAMCVIIILQSRWYLIWYKSSRSL